MKLRKYSLVVIATTLMLLAAPAAQAQVLQQVPSDALFVVKFNKLKATSDKIAALATKLGLVEMKSEFADPLGSMKKEMKITQGLNDAGDAAVVVLQGKKDEEIIVLLPVTDYAAFSKNFADAKTEGAITTFKSGFAPGDSYMTQWGNFAAIASSKEALAKKPDGLVPAGLSAKELDSKDVVAYANMKVARVKILPEIAKHRAKFIADFEKNFQRGMNPRTPPAAARRPGAPRSGAAAAGPATQPAAVANAQAQKFAPIIRSMLNRGIDIAEQLVRDSDAAAYGISISDAGIGTTALVDFSPQSTTGQRVAQIKQSDESLLKGLPATSYIFYGGLVSDPKVAQTVITELAAPIETEASTLGADGQPIKQYIDSLKTMWGSMTGQTFGWVVPKGALGQEAIFQLVSVTRGDAKKIMAAQQQLFTSQQAFMEMFQPPQMRGMVKTDYKPAAKTIEGVALDQFTSQITPPAGARQTPQAMQMQQAMMWMWGPNGMNGLAGALGEDKIVGAFAATDATLTQLIQSAKADQDNLSNSTGLKEVTAKLPQKRAVAGYFAADQLATTVANYAKMFGMPVNLQLPQNLPPIGFTIGAEGSTFRTDSYIPAQLVQSITAAVQQTMMQMKGGVRPGGPGGL